MNTYRFMYKYEYMYVHICMYMYYIYTYICVYSQLFCNLYNKISVLTLFIKILKPVY